MEGASNGGMLYHEVQESKLCAVHCVNTVLQGPFFSEFDLAALASDLDTKERQMMMLELQGGAAAAGAASGAASGDFLSVESHNVSLDGDFSIQPNMIKIWVIAMVIAGAMPTGNPVADTTLLPEELVLPYGMACPTTVVGLLIYFGILIKASRNPSGGIAEVLQKALEVWDLQVIPLDSPIAEHAQVDPELENAFICHLQDHWFCIRKVNGEWYNFDSLYAAPQYLSKFYLSAYLDSLKTFGWSIFLVRGNFPKECPMSSSEASNGYGQWLSPDDAERITKSCNSTQAPPQSINRSQHRSDPPVLSRDAGMVSEVEDEDLKAAIAASLMDSFPATASAETPTPVAETPTPQNENQSSEEKIQ
uniref:ubiquitinyl hydrolase 1 n=1 Tax=Fagus sylvatica TaxID=28930 RepID=A0A2N9FAA3_FAGSY